MNKDFMLGRYRIMFLDNDDMVVVDMGEATNVVQQVLTVHPDERFEDLCLYDIATWIAMILNAEIGTEELNKALNNV